MSKRACTFEWSIAKDEADWAAHSDASSQVMPPGMAPTHSSLSLKQFRAGIVAFLLLLLTSAGGGRTSHPTPLDAEATTQPAPAVAPGSDSLVASIMTELTATGEWQQGVQKESGRHAAAPTYEPDGDAGITLPVILFHEEQAVVRIVTPARSGTPAYRQTRFYQRIGPDWRQTAPSATLWGPQRSLATSSFVFQFRQQDAAVVMAVAPQVDTLYTTLRHNFGLPPPPGEKLVIEVSMTQSPGAARFQPHNHERFVMEDRWVVASPALYLAPVELTDADLLAQSIALPLLTQVSAQASEQHQIGAAWQPMMSGLHLWQVWDTDLPLAGWREEIVKWVYNDLPAIRPEQAIVLPAHYTELCAEHKLWMPSPTQLNIPLLCAKLDLEIYYLSLWDSRDPLTRLDQLAITVSPDEHLAQADDVQPGRQSDHAVALATLVEYAVATYGRERLPVLVAGLSQYESWDALLPAVFGVSATEFEAGWQAYLAARYGVPSSFFAGRRTTRPGIPR